MLWSRRPGCYLVNHEIRCLHKTAGTLPPNCVDFPLQSVIKILFCTYVWLMWEHLLGISWGPRLSWPVTWGHTSVCGWRSQWGRYHADTGCCWWHNLKRDNGSTDTQHVSYSTEQRTRSVSSGLSKQLGHMPRIRSKQSIHQMGRFAHLSVTSLTQYFSLPLSPVRSDPSKEAVTNDQSRKGNLFDFFACRRS